MVCRSILLLDRMQEERSRTVSVHGKLQMKPGNCEKSVTMKNTTQFMSPHMSLLSWPGLPLWDLAKMILPDQLRQSSATNIESKGNCSISESRMLAASWFSNTSAFFPLVRAGDPAYPDLAKLRGELSEQVLAPLQIPLLDGEGTGNHWCHCNYAESKRLAA